MRALLATQFLQQKCFDGMRGLVGSENSVPIRENVTIIPHEKFVVHMVVSSGT
jgi:hypothetical protein